MYMLCIIYIIIAMVYYMYSHTVVSDMLLVKELSKSTHLSPPCFDHELPGEVGGGLWLQGPDHYALVQWISVTIYRRGTLTYLFAHTI